MDVVPVEDFIPEELDHDFLSPSVPNANPPKPAKVVKHNSKAIDRYIFNVGQNCFLSLCNYFFTRAFQAYLRIYIRNGLKQGFDTRFAQN